MPEQLSRIVALTGEAFLANSLQKNLPDFEVIRTGSMSEISEAARKPFKVAAFVVHPKSSDDWMNFEFLSTAYASVPRFAVLEANALPEETARATGYGARATFNINNTSALATLIKTSIGNVIASGDRNAAFLEIFGKMSDELQRLHSEFTETALRTLPQPNVAEDTRNNLKRTLLQLQAIKIAP